MTDKPPNKVKTKEITPKTFKDNNHSDETIRNVGKLISLKYRNNEIAKMLNIRPETVSRIRSYLKKNSWSSTKFVNLARNNIELALQDGDIKLSEKVFDHTSKLFDTPPAQQAPVQTNIQVNAYDPTMYVRGAQSQNKPPINEKAGLGIGTRDKGANIEVQGGAGVIEDGE